MHLLLIQGNRCARYLGRKQLEIQEFVPESEDSRESLLKTLEDYRKNGLDGHRQT